MDGPLGEMNSNLKSVDVNVPGRWLTKAKKEWSKGWPNLESWNFSVQTHALLSSILPSSSKLQRLRRFQSFLNGWGNSFSSNQTRYIFLVVYERKLLEALVHLFLFGGEKLVLPFRAYLGSLQYRLLYLGTSNAATLFIWEISLLAWYQLPVFSILLGNKWIQEYLATVLFQTDFHKVIYQCTLLSIFFSKLNALNGKCCVAY